MQYNGSFTPLMKKRKKLVFVMQGIDIVKCLEDKLEKEVRKGGRGIVCVPST
jgi:hypothetical protein